MTQSPPVSRPSVALIGISGYAEIYVHLLLSEETRSRAELTAAVVIPSDQQHPMVARLRERGVRIYASYESMLETERGRIDLCVIPTGIQWHARMTCAALRAGAHVLVEKPLAGSLADAEAVRSCERETGRWVAVGFQDLYTETLAWLKQQLLDGAIGRLKSIRVIGLWPRSDAYYTRNHWAGRLHIDGAATFDSPLNNAFAHFVNLALFLAGSQPHGAAAAEIRQAELYRAHDIESFDTAVVIGRALAGIDLWFGVSHACGSYREPEIHIEGDSGRAGWLHERECFVAPDDRPEVRRPVPGYDEARRAMMNAVLNRLKDSGAAVCGTDIAVQHTGLIDTLHRNYAIESLAADVIELRRVEGHANPIPTIPEIESLLDQAMVRGCALRELGFEPAVASRR